jgi:hypothetical protein
MNNLYKSIKVIAVLAVAVIGLVACQNDNTDLFAIDSNLANKQMKKHPFYCYVRVDSVLMNTTMYEWNLTENEAGEQVGYYRVATTGNGLDSDATDSLTWNAVMSEDGLSMLVSAELKEAGRKELVWRNGVVEADGYATSWFDISEAKVLRTLHDIFYNIKFVVNDTTPSLFYDKKVFKYLHWTQVQAYLSLDSINAYDAWLMDYKDTIAWFNNSVYCKGNPVVDYVKHGKNPQASGQYKGLYLCVLPLSKEEKLILTDTIVLGPARIVNSEMNYNLVNGEYKGDYVCRIQEWSQDYYMDPAEPTATWLDSTYSIVDAIWTPSEYINTTTFTVLMKGHETTHVQASKAGKETKNVSTDKAVAFHPIALKEYDRADSIPTIKVGDIIYKQVK